MSSKHICGICRNFSILLVNRHVHGPDCYVGIIMLSTARIAVRLMEQLQPKRLPQTLLAVVAVRLWRGINIRDIAVRTYKAEV